MLILREHIAQVNRIHGELQRTIDSVAAREAWVLNDRYRRALTLLEQALVNLKGAEYCLKKVKKPG